MAADGSLKFDTKIDTTDFDKSISNLEKAFERFSATVDRLAEKIASGFQGAGAAVQDVGEKASDAVESVGSAADESAKHVKSLQEQMDAISVHAMQDTASDTAQSAPVSAPTSEESLNYDPKAMAAVFGDAASEIHNFAEAVAQYGSQAGAVMNTLSAESTKAGQAMEEASGQGEEQAQSYVGFADAVKTQCAPFIAKLREELEKLGAAYQAAGVAGVVFQGMADLVGASIKLLVAAAKKLTSLLARLAIAGFKATANFAKQATRKIVDFGNKLGKWLADKAKQAVSSLKGLGKSSNKVSQSILKLSNMFKLMLIRMAMRAAIQGVKEGMQNIVQYSAAANQSVSSLMSGMTYLKNSFAAAFSPILSYVAPALNTLINLLATAIGYINQFFSALGGSKTFTKAVKVNQDYAKSLKSTGGAAKQAGKDAKKALAPFDDLVQIQQQETDTSGGSGGAGGVDPSQMFETATIEQGISDFASKLMEMFEAGDWGGIGQLIGQKINEAVQRFTEFISWENIGGKITAFVTAFTTMFNSLVATIDWYSIGIMMGTGINTLAMTLYLLLAQIDWFMLGNALSQGLMGLVNTVDWELFGATIGAYFQMKISGLLGFIIGADWPTIGAALATCIMGITSQINDWIEFGNQLATSLSTFFQTFDWAGAGTAVSDIVIGLLDALITLLTETDWWAFGDGVATSLENIEWSVVADRLFMAIGAALGGIAAFLGGLISDGVAAAKEYFQGKIEECGGNVWLGIAKGILDAIKGIGTWIHDNIFKPFIDGFKNAFGIHSPSTVMAEMGQYLWDGFCNGIKEFFSDPIGFIKSNITDPFVNGIKSLLGIHSPSTVLEDVGDNTVAGFNKGVKSGQSTSQSVVQSWASGVASWFSQKLGITSGNSTESQQWASNTMSGFNNAVSAGYTESRGVMENWADNVRKWFVGSGDAKGVNRESWQKFADDVIKSFADEITTKHIATQDPTETWADNVRKWFAGEDDSKGVNEASWAKFGENIINAFKEKINSSHAETQRPVKEWAKNVREWFWGDSNPEGTGGMYEVFYNMAKRINEGFAKGISDFAHLAKDAIRQWASDIMDEAEEEFDINSPSKEFHTIAEYVVKGFNNGIADLASSSVSTAQRWLDSVMDVFDGVGIQIPVGLNIPNAVSYLPRMASGAVVPPRAGETSTSSRNMSGYGQEEAFNYLTAKIDELISRINADDGRPMQIVLNLSGNLAALARVLKPELDKEASRKGVSLVIVGGV